MTHECSIPVNLRNPGQFFACCGILYCADRMFGCAEGYFDEDKFIIKAECERNPINQIIKNLKCDLDLPHADEADSPLSLDIIPIRFDFYNHFDNRKKIKLFAGQETFKKIISRWINRIKEYDDQVVLELQQFEVIDIPSGLDTDTSWNALDVGFSLNQQGMERRSYPLVEFFAHIGIQTYSWNAGKDRKLVYKTWPIPLPITIARVVAAGALGLPKTRCFQFTTEKTGQKQVLNIAQEINKTS